jgi:hypothetical protein
MNLEWQLTVYCVRSGGEVQVSITLIWLVLPSMLQAVSDAQSINSPCNLLL